MFELLSKKISFFSIPIYLIFLSVIIIFFNTLEFNTITIVSGIVAFIGFALGYFTLEKIDLTHGSHLPYFLYTLFIFATYPGHLDIGLAVSLLINSLILLILSDNELSYNGRIYTLIGVFLGINFIFLPTIYPLIIFVFFHIIRTSERTALNLFRLFFGLLLCAIIYFSFAYFLGMNDWDSTYLPLIEQSWIKDFFSIELLSPVIVLLLYAILDHFLNYQKKNPTNRYKYNFLLFYTISLLLTVFFYMGEQKEYLLLLSFPVSVLLSRMLRFLPKFWLRESALWLIISSMLLFKISDYFNLHF